VRGEEFELAFAGFESDRMRAASSRCGLTGIFLSGNDGGMRGKAEIGKAETLKLNPPAAGTIRKSEGKIFGWTGVVRGV
jgi:hypothetical protein